MIKKSLLLGMALNLAATTVAAEDTRPESAPEQKPTPEQSNGPFYLKATTNFLYFQKFYGGGNGLVDAFTYPTMWACIDALPKFQAISTHMLTGVCTNRRDKTVHVKCISWGNDDFVCGPYKKPPKRKSLRP